MRPPPVNLKPFCARKVLVRDGMSGLFDMSGNAVEWVDSYTGAKGDGGQCFAFGGSYESALKLALRREQLSIS